MSFSVDKVADLAYLKLSDSERLTFEKQFPEILKYVDQLQSVSMSLEEAKSMGAFHVSLAFYESLKLDSSQSLRDEDESEAIRSLILTNDEALRNAPKSGGIPGELLYEVPSIIER